MLSGIFVGWLLFENGSRVSQQRVFAFEESDDPVVAIDLVSHLDSLKLADEKLSTHVWPPQKERELVQAASESALHQYTVGMIVGELARRSSGQNELMFAKALEEIHARHRESYRLLSTAYFEVDDLQARQIVGNLIDKLFGISHHDIDGYLSVHGRDAAVLWLADQIGKATMRAERPNATIESGSSRP